MLQTFQGSDQAIPFFKSHRLHKNRLAPAAPPLGYLAPDLRFDPKRSRALANASFTKLRLPITAPSVKYRTLQRNTI
jgi:hypothetical protein